MTSLASVVVLCPRCPPGALVSFTEPGKLAAHLVEDHQVSAGLALGEARKAFGVLSHSPRPQLAPTPVPAHPAPKETPMAKKKTRRTVTCRTCGKPGHIAKTCPDTIAAAVAPPRGRAPRPVPAVQGGGVAQAIETEIAKYEGKIATLKQALAVLNG